MRIEKVIIAVIVSVLAMFAVQATAVADDDPGMTYNGKEMPRN